MTAEAPRERTESFHVDRTGFLVRSVVPRVGKPYIHRCSPEVLQKVSFAFDEAPDGGLIIDDIAASEKVPLTQVAVALAFLLDRGIVEVYVKRNYAATIDVNLDAMTEYHALREKGPADPAFGYEEPDANGGNDGPDGANPG